jgi:hypothetical protein
MERRAKNIGLKGPLISWVLIGKDEPTVWGLGLRKDSRLSNDLPDRVGNISKL